MAALAILGLGSNLEESRRIADILRRATADILGRS